jgi:hypothetical protein
MKSRFLPLAFGLAGLAAQTANAGLSLEPISSVRNGNAADLFDQSAAEIVKFDAATRRLFVVNSKNDAIDIFDASNPASPVLVTSVDLSAYGNPNSVDVNPRAGSNEVAVAIGAPDKAQRGKVAFLNTNGEILQMMEVGFLPDMLTYTPNGRQVVVANEGEPNEDYSVDPEGSVSIIDLNGRNRRVTEIGFSGLTAADIKGVRISGPEGTTIAQDLEPEYVAVEPGGRFAFVTLQENNAVAKVDLLLKKLVRVMPLGSIDHGQLGHALDASDKDGMIRIANWPVKGLFMPDGIAAYVPAGKPRMTCFVTANEGDGREWGSYNDGSRVKSLSLDPSAFPLAATLKTDDNLGRLTVLNTQGDVDGDGDSDELYSFGTRSFSIFSEDGKLLFDSGDMIERYLAENYPDAFNAEHTTNAGFDGRSDNKGPEPETVKLGRIGDRTFAFVGLERFSGIMAFDITDPQQVTIAGFVAHRDFSVAFDSDHLENVAAAGDLGPEGIDFIPATSSPTGRPLLAVAHEVSGTTTLYDLTVTP